MENERVFHYHVHARRRIRVRGEANRFTLIARYILLYSLCRQSMLLRRLVGYIPMRRFPGLELHSICCTLYSLFCLLSSPFVSFSISIHSVTILFTLSMYILHPMTTAESFGNRLKMCDHVSNLTEDQRCSNAGRSWKTQRTCLVSFALAKRVLWPCW